MYKTNIEGRDKLQVNRVGEGERHGGAGGDGIDPPVGAGSWQRLLLPSPLYWPFLYGVDGLLRLWRCAGLRFEV